ncbi:MAG: hypothetical protein R3F11_28815 [Verrucomicrobiales bacterium]
MTSRLPTKKRFRSWEGIDDTITSAQTAYSEETAAWTEIHVWAASPQDPRQRDRRRLCDIERDEPTLPYFPLMAGTLNTGVQ